MDDIVRLPAATRLQLLHDLSHAEAFDKSVRIMTGVDREGDTFVKWDAGSGWTPPYYTLDW